MEEVEHVISILKEIKQSLKEEDSVKLKELSNQTIHAASIQQHTDSITLAILIYTLSKLLERKESLKVKNWDSFIKKINSFITLAISALEEKKEDKYIEYLERIRKTISSISISLKPYIEEVLRKASINKASKMYEHGISLGQTAKLLGVTQWELTEYAGQTKISDDYYNSTLDIKRRAQMALEFFS